MAKRQHYRALISHTINCFSSTMLKSGVGQCDLRMLSLKYEVPFIRRELFASLDHCQIQRILQKLLAVQLDHEWIRQASAAFGKITKDGREKFLKYFFFLVFDNILQI